MLERPDGDPATMRTVCPGEHRFGGGEQAYSVVWWSPETGVLNLDAEAPLGLRRDDLIVKDVAPDIRARYERDYISWRNARKEAISSAEQPSIEVMTATAAAQSSFMARLDEIDVAVEQVAGDIARPGGIRFGTLVHALLADVPLAPGDDLLDRLAAAHGRVLGAEPEEIAAAAAVVRRVLGHPMMRDAARAAGVRCSSGGVRRSGVDEAARFVLYGNPRVLASAEGDDAADGVVRRNADGHAITGNDLDSEAAHPAAELREYLMSLVALHAIQPAAVNRHDGTLHINQIILAQLLSFRSNIVPRSPAHCKPIAAHQ